MNIDDKDDVYRSKINKTKQKIIPLSLGIEDNKSPVKPNQPAGMYRL